MSARILTAFAAKWKSTPRQGGSRSDDPACDHPQPKAALAAGERYEIRAVIGAGGMGGVYRARDPSVNRDVAIRFPMRRSAQPLRREARAVAALNHPNICTSTTSARLSGDGAGGRADAGGADQQGAVPLDEALRHRAADRATRSKQRTRKGSFTAI